MNRISVHKLDDLGQTAIDRAIHYATKLYYLEDASGCEIDCELDENIIVTELEPVTIPVMITIKPIYKQKDKGWFNKIQVLINVTFSVGALYSTHRKSNIER